MSNNTRALDFVEWKELNGKEARGVDKKVDLGEIHGIGRTYVVTKKGLVNKDKFYIPKALAEKYDGKTVWFNVTESLKQQFLRENPPSDEDMAKYKTVDSPTYIDDKIVIMSENSLVSAEPSSSEFINELPVRDWSRVVHKNVRSLEGEPIGNIVAIHPDSFHVETPGSQMAYDIPKSEVDGFDGAEVRLKAPVTDLERYVKRR